MVAMLHHIQQLAAIMVYSVPLLSATKGEFGESPHGGLAPSIGFFVNEPSCQFEYIQIGKAGAAERFAELRKSQPVVLTHGIKDWAAMSSWGWEALRARVGDIKLTSEDVHPGVLGQGWEEGMSLSATMDAVASKPRLLLLKPQSSIVQELIADFEVPLLLKSVQRFGPQLSIGGRGQAAVFNDHQENWLAQVFGRKLWMVYPPTIFGPPPYADTMHPCKYLEMENRLPEASRQLRSCVIHPGQIISLPEKWGHSTCNLDDYTVGLGYVGAIDHMSAAEQAAVVGNWTAIEASMANAGVPLQPLLELAAEAGHVAATRGLLRRGAEPTRVDAKGRSALHAAAKTGWAETVRLLLEARGTPEVQDVDGNLPLLEAAYAGHLSVVRVLCACSEANKQNAGRCLAAERCANSSSESTSGNTPLESAALGGHLPVARFLFGEGGIGQLILHHNMDIPLTRAASGGHAALIQLLLDNRAAIDSRTRDGKPPISWSARFGHLSAIEMLLRRGANISHVSLNGQTALLEAVRRRHPAAAQLLLNHRSSANVLDKQNRSPLHYAAKVHQVDMVDLLLISRAAVSAKDKQGRTAVDEAARMDLGKVLQKLLSAAGTEARGLAANALALLDGSHNALGGALGSESRQVLQRHLDLKHEL